uniref:Uncharacterized protein n=1 Tax=Acrobeloides nanus TaxID=290746 RepID=A0A914CGW4_9BILA
MDIEAEEMNFGQAEEMAVLVYAHICALGLPSFLTTRPCCVCEPHSTLIDGACVVDVIKVHIISEYKEKTSLSCSPSSTKDTSTLNLAYAIINMNEPKIFSEIELTDAEDLKQLENSINENASAEILLVSTAEDIRQCLFPFAASFRTEHDTSTKHTQLPDLFHRFINVEALPPTPALNFPPLDAPLTERVQALVAIIQQYENLLEQCIETVSDSYIPAVCVDTFVDSGLVARVRGLQWQVNDNDVARFFVGLNIA